MGGHEGSYGLNGWLYSGKGFPNSQDSYKFENENELPIQTPVFADSIWVDFGPRATNPPARDVYQGATGAPNMARLSIPRQGR